MSARGFPSDLPPTLDLKGEHFNLMYHHASSGDKMIAQRDVDPASTCPPPAVSQAQYRFPPADPLHGASSHTSSSPSDSRSASPSNGTHAFLIHPPETCTGTLDLAHPTPRPATPELPPYRPLPPMSPLSILSTLDHIASSAPKKKSHARKQPAGHIPRPRNAFILFRCLFVSQQAVPASVEKDHRNISRIAGRVWKSMSDSQKEPWVKAAELEKSRHEERWPGYRYNPVQTQAALRRLTGAAVSAAGGRTTCHGPALGLSADERRGRTMARSLTKSSTEPLVIKGEDEDAMGYPSQQQQQQQQHHGQQHLHAPLARVASVPPPSSRPQGLFEQWRGQDIDAHDVDGDAEMMPPPSQHQSHGFAFTMPQAPTTPTPMNSGRLPSSGSSSASYMWDDPFPPASPSPPSMSIRLSARRSSSCPPLPPPGMFTFPFNNPTPWNSMASSFANACSELDRDVYQSPSEPESPSPLPFRNPFSSTTSSVSSSVPVPVPVPVSGSSDPYRAPSTPSTPPPPPFTNPFASSTSSSPFAYVFPTGYVGGDVARQDGTPDEHRPLRTHHHALQYEDPRPLTAPDEHRPFTAPESNFPAPRHFMHGHGHGLGLGYGHGHGYGETSSRLMHRRGSSLDRAIASSSIAGAMGGSLSRSLGMGYGHAYTHTHTQANSSWGSSNVHHGGEARETLYAPNANANAQYFSHGGNVKGVRDASSLCSSGTGTPSLSPSPPSSFEGSFEAQAQVQQTQVQQPSSTGMYHVQDDPASLGDKNQHVDNANDMSVCSLVQEQQQQQQQAVAVVPPESFTTHSSAPTSSATHAEPFAMPSTGSGANKISARLFGSQGAQLGLDLDLDVPLSLDVSFDTVGAAVAAAAAAAAAGKDEDTPATASPPYSSISSSTSFSSMSTSTSYSSLGTALTTPGAGTVGAPPGTAGTTATSCRSESGDADEDASFPYTPGSPSPFMYTHAGALLERSHHQHQHQHQHYQQMSMGGGEEFKFVERMGGCDEEEDERRVVSPVHAS